MDERNVGRILKTLTFRRISVRPRHPQADAEAQETHKKTLPISVHRVDIGTRENEPGANAAAWTDGTEQIGRLVALIARGCGSAATPRPDAGQAALLADAGLILPP